MPRNDPSETGGLFVGRRPGTAPVRYRGQPTTAGGRRRRIDSVIAAVILTVETLLLVTLWGPQPAAWLWVGSQVDYYADSVSIGILTAFVGMIASVMLTIAGAKRLDHAWQLVRRAAGHPQKEGMLTRIFVVSAMIGVSVFTFWFLIINGPGSSTMSGAGAG
jgi:hypothetical protein